MNGEAVAGCVIYVNAIRRHQRIDFALREQSPGQSSVESPRAPTAVPSWEDNGVDADECDSAARKRKSPSASCHGRIPHLAVLRIREDHGLGRQVLFGEPRHVRGFYVEIDIAGRFAPQGWKSDNADLCLAFEPGSRHEVHVSKDALVDKDQLQPA